MANNLFNILGRTQQPNFMQMLNQLKSNPVQFLTQRKFNLPQNFQGGPQEIINHLVNTGQVSQQQINQIQQRLMNTNQYGAGFVNK